MSERIENETELIQTYLAPLAAGYPGALELKDDAAVIGVPDNTDIVVTTDPIIEGVHFFSHDRADDIAWKALAVNMSDLAAKGATPLAYTMALAFPKPPEKSWMALFAEGLSSAQQTFGCHLAGGDTDHTSGPLSISITAFGTIPKGTMIRRTSARVGDGVYVTGTLGDAALGLALYRDNRLLADALSSGDRGLLVARYLRPNPRLGLAQVLRTYATAALDVSDGFAKDLARLVAGARGGIKVQFADLPLSASARQVLKLDERYAAAVVSGGDDYEVLFCAPPACEARLLADCAAAGTQVARVGVITTEEGVTLLDSSGVPIAIAAGGYDHFA